MTQTTAVQPAAPATPAARPSPALEIAPTDENVAYGPHERNVLDFWQAPAATAGHATPLLLFIHGGGFRNGDKRGIDQNLLRNCLSAGISVASINYRLSHHAIYPAPFTDSARALQFIRSRADEWHLDPTRVAASGGSAGAGISLWLGFRNDMADPTSVDPVTRQSTRLTCMAVRNGQTSYDTRFIKTIIPGDTYRVEALVQLYGLSGPDESANPRPEKARLMEEASALTYVKPGVPLPPVFLTYNQSNQPPAPDIAQGPGIHHPTFGFILKERLDMLGVECIVRCAGESDLRPTEMDFLRQHLGV
jgi:acetyl esterase/lipase